MSNVFHYGCRTSWFIFSDRLQNSLSLLNSIYTLMKYSGTPTPLSSYYHIYFSGSNISTGCLQKASNILPLLHHICSDPCRISFICKSFLYMVWVPCFARYQKNYVPTCLHWSQNFTLFYYNKDNSCALSKFLTGYCIYVLSCHRLNISLIAWKTIGWFYISFWREISWFLKTSR